MVRSLVTGKFSEVNPIASSEASTELYEMASDDPNGSKVDQNLADDPQSSGLAPGSSELSSLSHSDRRFFQSVARIGEQVAEALEYANRQGVLHRDIKPSNLLLDARGNVGVADFGLAKIAEADDITHTGDILGIVRYMAPERFRGHCDARSDLYSLGLTLYELLAFRPACEGSVRHILIDRVLHEDPPSLRRLAPSVPRDLETIITKAIARDPAARYATAAALADDSRRFLVWLSPTRAPTRCHPRSHRSHSRPMVAAWPSVRPMGGFCFAVLRTERARRNSSVDMQAMSRGWPSRPMAASWLRPAGTTS